MIPLPPQVLAARAVLAGLPWRLIGIVTVAIFVLALGWRASVWREGWQALEATEKALATVTAERDRYAARESSAWQALREAEGKAAAKEAEDRATAERIENELQTQLAAADARGRDLARRLLDATRKTCPGAITVSQPAGAAGQPAQAGGEPGDPGGVGEAIAAHLAACESDATRLAGWQAWWAGVSAGR